MMYVVLLGLSFSFFAENQFFFISKRTETHVRFSCQLLVSWRNVLVTFLIESSSTSTGNQHRQLPVQTEVGPPLLSPVLKHPAPPTPLIRPLLAAVVPPPLKLLRARSPPLLLRQTRKCCLSIGGELKNNQLIMFTQWNALYQDLLVILLHVFWFQYPSWPKTQMSCTSQVQLFRGVFF